MILEITPPPGGAGRARAAWRRITAYSIGLVASTTVVGVAAGTIGAFARTIMPGVITQQRLWMAGIACTAVAYSLHETGLVHLPAPQVRWQVPAHWSRHGKTMQALLYGIVLGAELFTLMPYAAFYVLLPLEATLGPGGGLLLGLTYGLARVSPSAVSIAVAYRRGTVHGVARCITGNFRLFHTMNGVALAAVGVVLVGALLRL